MAPHVEKTSQNLGVGGRVDRRREAKSRRGVDGEEVRWCSTGSSAEIVKRTANVHFYARQRFGGDFIPFLLATTGGMV